MTSEDPPFVAGPEERALSPAEADILAASLLGELRTRLGGLQIAHARRVADAVRDAGGDDGTYAAALLHDVVEKGCITGAQLLSTTRDAEVVRLVGLLTQEPDEVYEDYLVRCSQDADAVVIKRADLIDKFDPGDSTVSADEAAKIRQSAEERLVLLESLATGSPPRPGTSPRRRSGGRRLERPHRDRSEPSAPVR